MGVPLLLSVLIISSKLVSWFPALADDRITFCISETLEAHYNKMEECSESQDVPMETQQSGEHNDCDSHMTDNQVVEEAKKEKEDCEAVEEGKNDSEEDMSQNEPEQDQQGASQIPTSSEKQAQSDGLEQSQDHNSDPTQPEAESSVDKQEPIKDQDGGNKESDNIGENKGRTDDKDGEEVKSKLADDQGQAGDTKEEEEEKEEIPPFPDTLEGFGYHIEGGRLTNINTGEGFVYEVRRGKKTYNQRHYEAIGEVVTEEVYKLLETEAHLKRVDVPVNAKKDHSFIFMSEDALVNEKLMVLIHGSGVVRAGQWARSLIINDCLNSGTQLPFIAEAKKEGYGVIVMNTNENSRRVGGKIKPFKECGSPEQHARYVWKHFVKRSKARHIDIVAHSFGGVVAVELANSFSSHFKKCVQRIAFTDSVHWYNPVAISRSTWTWLSRHTVNWVSSDEVLDAQLETLNDGIRRLSAGTTKHVETSWFSFRSIFEYFKSGDIEKATSS